jgi:hypothetical protein
MPTRTLLALLLCLAACDKRPAAPARPPEPAAPTPSDPPTGPMTANLVLTSHTQRAPLALGHTALLRYDGLAVESLAASPDGAYPGGSGVSLTLYLEGGPAPLRRDLSLLSPGYTSRDRAWFGDHRVTLLDVKDLYTKSTRVELLVERVTGEPLPGPATAARVVRGDSVELDADTRLEFLGNPARQVAAGERSPRTIAVRYHVGGEQPESAELDVGPDGSRRSWDWRDWRFTVTAHAHDEWLQLEIRRLRLAPAPRP